MLKRDFEPPATVELSALARLRSLAVRRGVWFRALSRLDRGLVDLALRVLKGIRSGNLARELCSIVQRLMDALAGKVTDRMLVFGKVAARRISLFAQKWGNKAAQAWVNDVGFARYLTIMKLNERFIGG